MARSFVAVIKDDLTGEVVDEKNVENIEFAINGKIYRIDLSKKNATEFHQVLDKYIAVAAKVGSSRPSRPAQSAKEDLAGIREWGKRNGFKVSERGRVSSDLKAAYANAH